MAIGISVIGAACRLPGAADIDLFFSSLRERRVSIGEVPPSRWDVARMAALDPRPGSRAMRTGGFLEQVDAFDWRALRIAPREARAMDPQHRLLLELAWEALEDAGLPLERVAGSKTGVYVGLQWNDWLRRQSRDPSSLDGYTAAGNPFSFAAARISHSFDLKGPSFALDAACSSSLVALHLALRALRAGEIDMAVVGSANLALLPDAHVIQARAGFLSPAGRCAAFDADADGVVRGEGGVALVLARSDTLSPSDRAYAEIRGTAIGHNGRNDWILAPRAEGQAEVMRGALADAGVDPGDVSYVELHGTGFPRGDVVEADALQRAYGQRSLRVGSVKGNMGSLEPASALVSVLKVALALHRETLLPTGAFESISEEVASLAPGLRPLTEAEPWRGARFAAVNATGLSGANAHAVLASVGEGHEISRRRPLFLPLSVRVPRALPELAKRWLSALRGADSHDALTDLLYTAAARRTHHPIRLAVLGGTREALISALQSLPDDAEPGVIGEGSCAEEASAWVGGAPMPGGAEGRCVSAPGHPWVRERLWIDLPEESPRESMPQLTLGAHARAQGDVPLLSAIRAAVGRILHTSPPPDDLPLFDAGLDSIGAEELRVFCEQQSSRSLPVTFVFEHPTIAQLASVLSGAPALVSPARPQAKRRAPVPIAVVGAECRLPGAPDLESYWQLLQSGGCPISEIPADRWPAEALYDPDPGKPGRTILRKGFFLPDIRSFDAEAFRLSPREAARLDPQQRLLLELSYEALERAAIATGPLAGSRTGIFVGVMGSDFAAIAAGEDRKGIDAHWATGSELSFAAGRIAHALGTTGPCLAVDTACSSSLVAVHLAAQSLRRGECDLALAGGVSLIQSPEISIFLSKARVLSPSGICRAFDASADGIGRGEGAGMVALARLDDAERLGLPVLAVLAGSAVSHDGRSGGLTVPSRSAQAQVIASALEDAGVSPASVGYVEAHGTGTPLGDPIELSALAEIYGVEREAPCLVGSVKTNIGHLDAAAGIAGLLKAVLSLGRGAIPKHLHLSSPTRAIDWQKAALVVPSAETPWPKGAPLAAVSAFGLSGTNAHVILAPPPPRAAVRASAKPAIVCLSARTQPALDESARRLEAALSPALGLGSIEAALSAGRTPGPARLALVARSSEELRQKLSGGAGIRGEARGGKLAWLLSGQGSQRAGMARALYGSEPALREALDRCAAIVAAQGVLDRPLLEGIWGEPGWVDQPQNTQVALFALEWSLAAMLGRYGVLPDLLIGHSVGEIVAACLSGVFSLEDALRLVLERGRLAALAPPGAMLAVSADLDPEDLPVGVEISGFAAPGRCTVAGPSAPVAELRARLEARGVRVREVAVSRAFHTSMMQEASDALASFAQTLAFGPLGVPFFSNVTGELASDEVRSGAYWGAQMRAPVRFDRALQSARALGAATLLEVGPRPVLLPYAAAVLPEAARAAVLRGEGDDEIDLAEALCALWASGQHVDLSERTSGSPRASLPPSAFARRPCLLPVRFVARDTPSGALFERTLSLGTDPWLADHLLDGTPTAPLAAIAEWMREIASREAPRAVSDLEVRAPLVVQAPLRLQVLRAGDRLTLFVRPEAARSSEPWQQVASAQIAPIAPRDTPVAAPVDPAPLDPAEARAALASAGLSFGPALCGLVSLSSDGARSAGIVEAMPATGDGLVHPAALDAALHVTLGLTDGRALPVGIGSYAASGAAPGRFEVRASAGPGGLVDLDLVGPEGVFAEIRGLSLRERASAAAPLMLPVWTAVQPGEPLRRATVAGSGPLASALRGRLEEDPSTLILLPEAGLSRGAARSAVEDVIARVASLEGRSARLVAVGSPDDLAHAAVFGALRAIAWEHPEIEVIRLSVARALDPEPLARAICGALAAGEDELCLMPEGICARRWETVPAVEGRLSARGTWLVTGGTGGVGAAVAGFLRERGARVLTCSRSGADILADLGDPREVERAIREAGPDLRGVVHAAGVLADGTAVRQPRSARDAVFAAKLGGAVALVEATRALSLDAIVLVSSTSGAVGMPGQAAYAAANAALDAIARRERASGRPVTSIAWGPWSEAGMAARQGESWQRRAQSMGYRPLGASPSLAQLEAALLGAEPCVIAASIDRVKLRASHPRGASLSLAKPRAELSRPSAVSASSSWESLRQRPHAQRLSALVERVGGIVASVLEQGAPPQASGRLFDLGLDSLLAMELRGRLGAASGLPLPASFVFDHPTIDAIARAIDARLVATEPSPSARREAPAAPSVREVAAVVGIGCRMPGGVDGPDALWELLSEGRSAVQEVPPSRWDLARYYDPDPDAVGPDGSGRMACRHGSFLDDVSAFDAAFFGISPREAERMDPQQRILLEVVYEALEDAAIAPDRLSGSRTGVFIGGMLSDYASLQRRLRGPDSTDAHQAAGEEPSFLAGRLSYALGLRGPSMVVSTACSSSLVAVHLAMQSLLRGECDLAIAGGVNLTLDPAPTLHASRMHALSKIGRCATFDASADGYVRGEGAGILVLQRRSEAHAARSRVRAVLLGSATGHAGASGGVTVPSGPAQAEVIRAALRDARVSPGEVAYVEAHGTGTPLGDPIELLALADVLAEDRREKALVGSIKTNLGHLEAAAGVAGLLKVILSLDHGVLPPHLHLERPTPAVDWDLAPFSVASVLSPWPRCGLRRVAGVSSFGLSGINAHVLVGEAEATVPPEVQPDEGPLVMLVSAASEPALRSQAERWADALEEQKVAAGDLAFTSATARAALSWRAAVVSSDGPEAAAALLRIAPVGRASALRRVFVFPGQGAQWEGMGRDLLAREAFARAIAPAEEAIAAEAGFSVLGALETGEGLDRIERIQPVLFALGLGLSGVWADLGLLPDAVMGHSQGEVCAAVVAGALSVEDGTRVIVRRSALLREIAGRGAMALVELPLQAALARGFSVAASNGPRATVISGSSLEIESAIAALEREGIYAKAVRVDVASHSPQVEPLAERLLQALEAISPGPARIPFFSTVEGQEIPGERLDAAYWWANLRQPVLLDGTVRGLVGALPPGVRPAFIEISAHPVLSSALAESSGGLAAVAGTLRRDQSSRAEIRANAAKLWVAGQDIRWERELIGTVARGPARVWSHERFWVTPSKRPAGEHLHPLLGAATALATDPPSTAFHADWGLRGRPWLADHQVDGAVWIPGAQIALAMLSAIEQAGYSGGLRSLSLHRPLVLHGEEDLSVEIRASVSEVTLSVREGERWSVVATALVTEQPRRDLPLEERCDEPVSLEALGERNLRRGLRYGRAFRPFSSATRSRRSAQGLLDRAALDLARGDALTIALDAALQLLGLLDPGEEPRVPAGAARVDLSAGGPPVSVRAQLVGEPAAGKDLLGDVSVHDADGRTLVSVRGARIAALPKAPASARRDPRPELLSIAWRPAAPPEAASGVGEILLLEPSARGAREALSAQGYRVSPLDLGALPKSPPQAIAIWPPETEILGPEIPEIALARSGELLLAVRALLDGPWRVSPRLCLVTSGAVAADEQEATDLGQAPLWGFARVLALEHPEISTLRVDIGRSPTDALRRRAAAEIAAPTEEDQIALRGATTAERYVARLVRDPSSVDHPRRSPARGRPFALTQREPGRLESLSLVELPASQLREGELEIEVSAAGLNFRDVLAAVGAWTDAGEDQRGAECAGRVIRVGPGVDRAMIGQEVVALASRWFCSRAVALAALTAPLPPSLSAEQAAVAPVSFLTAVMALDDLARLEAGERVLVHNASGGVGLAAVAWARHVGAEIFATAGSEEKRQRLVEMGIARVADSRSTDFAERFREQTAGEGLDVVLSAMTGPQVDASFELLRDGGRYIEIGKREAGADRRLSTRPFLRNLSYALLDLRRWMDVRPQRVGASLRRVMSMLGEGALSPQPVSVWPIERAEEAFSHMARGRHIGRIALRFDEGPRIEGRIPWISEGTVLVTGGLGGLGLALARHLVDRGVRSLVLLGRRPSGPALAAVEQLRARASVDVASVDVADEPAMADLIAKIQSGGAPLQAVVHAAGVLDDTSLARMEPGHLSSVARPKVSGAWVLHHLTRDLPLRAFVLYGSASSLVGSPGQANYAAANAFLVALAAHRRSMGLPANVIEWGAFSDVGLAAAGDQRAERLESRGMASLTVERSHELLDAILAADVGHIGVLEIDARRWIEFWPGAARSPYWSELSSAPVEPERGEREQMASLPEPERVRALEELLQSELGRVLRADPAKLSPETPFSALGVDSLMSLELRGRLETRLGIRLGAALLYTWPTSRALAGFLAKEIGGGQPHTAPPEPARVEVAPQEEPISESSLSALSDDELMRLVRSRLEDPDLE